MIFINRILGRRAIPIYPLLLAIYPILILYRWNAERLSPTALEWPCLFALGIVIVLWGVLSFALGNRDKAALLTACLFFQSDVTGDFLELYSTDSHIPLIWVVMYGLLSLGSLGFTLRVLWLPYRQEFFKSFNKWADLTLLLLVLIIPAHLLIENIGDTLAWNLGSNLSKPAGQSHVKIQPDIYYIILDGYARQDVLADFLRYDNSPFINFLQKKGFYVASQSRCNYSVTFLSLASSLNMQYLDLLNKIPDQQEQASRMIRQNRIAADLKFHGYRIVHFATGFPLDDVNLLADQTYNSTSLDDFRMLVIRTSFLRFFFKDILVNSYRQRFYFNCEKLGDLARQAHPPSFVYAHFVIPHPPFVFTREGRMPTPHSFPRRPAGSRDWYPPDRYVDQLVYVTRHIQAVITKILEDSPLPPIIILQSDHGPGCDGISSHPTAKMLVERTGILNAYYVPEAFRRQLYPTISPVNTFRLLLNTCLGAHWPLAKDKTNYVWGIPPYRFMNVTRGPNETKISAMSPPAAEEVIPYLPTTDWAGD